MVTYIIHLGFILIPDPVPYCLVADLGGDGRDELTDPSRG
jgi:hypothetical protein